MAERRRGRTRWPGREDGYVYGLEVVAMFGGYRVFCGEVWSRRESAMRARRRAILYEGCRPDQIFVEQYKIMERRKK